MLYYFYISPTILLFHLKKKKINSYEKFSFFVECANVKECYFGHLVDVKKRKKIATCFKLAF